MAIERSLPENRQRFLDDKVRHFEMAKRKLEAAVEFCRKSEGEYNLLEQARSPAIVSAFSLLEMALRCQLYDVSRDVEASIRWAEAETHKRQPHTTGQREP